MADKAPDVSGARALIKVQQAELDCSDDFATEWQRCKMTGESWGGRGRGGRGVARQYACTSSASRDVRVDNVTLAYSGLELLAPCALRISHGQRYALIGRNGCGKSSLLERIASGNLPGFPPHLRVGILHQMDLQPYSEAACAVDVCLQLGAQGRRWDLEDEREQLQTALSNDGSAEDTDVSFVVQVVQPAQHSLSSHVPQRLGDIDVELEELTGPTSRVQTEEVLRGLGFKDAQLVEPAAKLSGGWRMRIRLAAALLSKPDILLLDEPTNHLDLAGVVWLQEYITSNPDCPQTLLIVSHDESFLSVVATEVIMMKDRSLSYFSGSYDEYLLHQEEAASRHSHLLDARVRQEEDARKAIAAMQASARDVKGGRNDKVLKQAKQKQEKMSRIGLFREDGRRYKLQSLATLDDDAVLLPDKVESIRGARDDRFEFPDPNDGGALRSVSGPDCPLVEFREATLGVNSGSAAISGFTQHICLGSRIAVVGNNGAGKTTLLRSIVGEIPLLSGSVTRVSGLRVAYVSQLCDFPPEVLRKSPSAHLQATFSVSEVEARNRLGRFGITGSTAMLPMALLSGGQRARVSFTEVTWNYPHLIVLDEPTNHLDIGALRALGAALSGFKGAVILVSHNASFCCSFCQDLWIVRKGTVCCKRGQETPFPELFGEYAASLSRSSAAAVSRARAESIQKAQASLKTAPKKESGGVARSSLF